MKMKLKMKRFFNLIEVSLAMGVTAVGILGAVTILPVALKTASAATYNAYLTDASNMIFAGIDDFLNEKCYLHRYEDEHKSDVTTEELQEIDDERSKRFADIFDGKSTAASRLNQGLTISRNATTDVGVRVELVKSDSNHGLIAFYSTAIPSNIEIPEEYTESFKEAFGQIIDGNSIIKDNVGRPLFAARYRIVVTDLEDDSKFKLDGLRPLEEVQTEDVTFPVYDRNGHLIKTEKIPGVRVPGTRRFMNLDELSNEEQARRREKNKLMKRVYIEFSWPYRAKYGARSKRTFIKEYYYTSN